MKNILITGGAGFIGSNLAEFLKKKKFNIYILDDLSVGNKSFISKIKGKFFKLKVEHISKIKNKIKFLESMVVRAPARQLLPHLYVNTFQLS